MESKKKSSPKKVRDTIDVKNKTGKRGRPKGSLKQRPFEQTRLGFFLKYEAPIEYELIMRSTPQSAFPKPSIHLIETIAIASHNPVFKKNKYFKYLQEYKEKGLYMKEPKLLTEERKKFYQSLMDTRVRKYIKEQKKAGFSPYALEV